ncbi:MAG: type II toxin-antitoxin system Phd/YefM family antitoxin [Coriobacteriales bacterium]|jgi:antitoxin YefM|nr:type II toxin-antitoxin system Phd/YefM family antitoxin [Coriobacteriales bacterium]
MASEVRNNLKKYLDRVNENAEELLIVRQRGSNAVLVGERDWSSIQETLLVYENPEVLAALRRSAQQLEEGDVVSFSSLEDLKKWRQT